MQMQFYSFIPQFHIQQQMINIFLFIIHCDKYLMKQAAAAGSRYRYFSVIADSQLQTTSVKMTASDRLFKNQSNFLISNFREFYKLWRDNQEAILTVKCCDGKLSIIFESSFQSPEIKPTLKTIVKRKVNTQEASVLF